MAWLVRTHVAAIAILAGCTNAQPDTDVQQTPLARLEAGVCANGDPAVQRHGVPCLCCHRGQFGVAGSVEPSVTRIVVIDGVGQTADMIPNPFGNFFQHLRLEPPLRPTIFGADGRRVEMRDTAPDGDCNACHRAQGTATVLGLF